MLYKTFVLTSIAGLLTAFSLAPSHSAKWQYRFVAGKKYSYHYKYESKASSADPNSNMDQKVEADIDVTVKSIDKKSNAILTLRATNVQEHVIKNGDWTPVRLALLPECEVTVDPTGNLVSGKIIRDDTIRKSGKQPLTEDQAMDRALHLVLYRQLARDTFYDGYAWRDTVPKTPPHPQNAQLRPQPNPRNPPPQAPAPPEMPMRTITSYSVSASTDANPRVVWTLTTDIESRGAVKGKEYSDVTHGIYSFDEATGMVSGYNSVTETHRGSDSYKTTKELTLKY
jgi:hypothetical protein